MARTDQSGDWGTRLSPSLAELESISIEAFARLPERFRHLCHDLTIQVMDFPEDHVIEDMGLESPFELLGLLEGRGISERFSVKMGGERNQMILFRRAILDYWSENEETLGDIVSQVLIHEIGHHFGLSDEDMEAVEEAAA